MRIIINARIFTQSYDFSCILLPTFAILINFLALIRFVLIFSLALFLHLSAMDVRKIVGFSWNSKIF